MILGRFANDFLLGVNKSSFIANITNLSIDDSIDQGSRESQKSRI